MKKFSFFLILLFWILVVLWHIPGLALAQNTDNLLNLPPLNQGTPAPNQNTGQLPIIDFSQPQPTNPPVSNQQSTLPTPQPLLNNQNQVQILSPNPTPNSNPNQPLPSVWKKYNIRELIGVGDPVGGGMVEYPENWQIYPDPSNRQVTFSEDASGKVCLKLYILSYLNYSTSSDYVATIIQMLSQSVSNLRVLKQDDNNVTPSQLALYGNNQTVSVYDLQGNYQGTEMFFHLEAGVNSLYTTSTGHAMIYWAPAQVYQDKFKNFFTRMRTSYKSSLR